jgi:hypothetical protein
MRRTILAIGIMHNACILKKRKGYDSSAPKIRTAALENIYLTVNKMQSLPFYIYLA